MLRNVLRHKRSTTFFTTSSSCLFILVQPPLRRSHLLTDSANALDSDTALHLLRRCSKVKLLEQAKQVHASILNSGLKSLTIFSKYLIRMYVACGSLDEARKVLDSLDVPDVFSWTELITAYARNGHYTEANVTFQRLILEGGKPDAVCLLAALNACKDSLHLAQGKLIHALIREAGYEADGSVGAALLSMYGRCGGEFEDMKQVFVELVRRDAVSPLSSYTMMKMLIRRGDKAKALKLFAEIKYPQSLEFTAALEACESFAQVEEIHGKAVATGMEVIHPSVGAALIAAYGRCGSLEVAAEVLKAMRPSDPRCWTELISAYVRNGYERKALQLFHEMQHRNVKPDLATFVHVIDACAALGGLIEGRLLHIRLVEVENVEMNSTLAASLVNMYSKCGSLEEACSVFADTTDRDLHLWNSLMDAFSIHGEAYLVLRLFRQMQQAGLHADQVTFSCMLSVCCNLGLSEPGYALFTMLQVEHGLTPNLSNCCSMVHLLGRAGRLEEAEELIEKSRFQSDAALWTCYMAACRSQGDVERGKRAAVRVFTLDPTDMSSLVILSRIYAWQGRGDMSQRMQKLIKERAKQEAGRSWTEMMGVVHEFVTSDKSHPQSEEIYAALEKLETVVENGSVEQERELTSRLVMHDVAEEDEMCVWKHSERLAVAFGLMNCPTESRLVIFKNRRVCSDCHGVLAIISKLSGREIVVRDPWRFHTFRDGSCSCGNYW